MMNLLRQDTRHPTPSLPLPSLVVELEFRCPCALIHSTILLLFPHGQPNDGLDTEVEAKAL